MNDVQITNHLQILPPAVTKGQYKSISQSDHLVRWGWGGSKRTDGNDWLSFVIILQAFMYVCLLMPCDHLLGKG